MCAADVFVSVDVVVVDRRYFSSLPVCCACPLCDFSYLVDKIMKYAGVVVIFMFSMAFVWNDCFFLSIWSDCFWSFCCCCCCLKCCGLISHLAAVLHAVVKCSSYLCAHITYADGLHVNPPCVFWQRTFHQYWLLVLCIFQSIVLHVLYCTVPFMREPIAKEFLG